MKEYPVRISFEATNIPTTVSVKTKKEGESEELTHLTEGSFEDTIIVVWV